MPARAKIPAVIKGIRLSLLTLVACLIWPPAAYSDDAQEPLFVKVFAGESLSSVRLFNKAVSRNLKNKVLIPDETTIHCKAGQRYGLGVIVSAPGKQTFSFETTAIWRDLNTESPPRTSTREHTLRKNQYGTRRFFFTVRDDSVEHDMTFVAHIGQRVFLRHKFLIRGCKTDSPVS